MKELTREKVVKEVTGYEAFDGKIFKTKEECEKYENSAESVINNRFNNLIGANNDGYGYSEYNLVETGSEEYVYFPMVCKSEEDLFALEHFCKFHNIHTSHKTFKLNTLYSFGNMIGDGYCWGCVVEGLPMANSVTNWAKVLCENGFTKEVHNFLTELLDEINNTEIEKSVDK